MLPATDPTIRVTNLSKHYGKVLALDDVSVQFFAGEIHAVLGENGAGKSTLMGILGGFIIPTAGNVELFCSLIPFGEPQKVRKLGVELIHQHFMLVPEFTVLENLELGALDRLTEGLKPQVILDRAKTLSESLGWEFNPQKKISDLSVGEQQRTEILKALLTDAKVYIFDEPTAVLGQDEVTELFKLLRHLKDQGKTVILIAHKLSEVLSVADRFTVLRRGRKTGETTIADATESQLGQWMVGDFSPLSASSQSPPQGPGLQIQDLKVKGDRGELAVNNVSFEVQKGQIFGIGGVDGNGQVELAEAIGGIRPTLAGQISWKGEQLKLSQPVTGYIPQDRHVDGLALEMSVRDNFLIAGYKNKALSKGPLLNLKAINTWAKGLVTRFDVKTDGVSLPIRGLSGGNQQKVIVGRTLDSNPELLIAVNPTRGLDVKAATSVHTQIRAARDAGASVVLISADLDELSALSDSLGFLSKGELTIGSDCSLLVGGTH